MITAPTRFGTVHLSFPLRLASPLLSSPFFAHQQQGAKIKKGGGKNRGRKGRRLKSESKEEEGGKGLKDSRFSKSGEKEGEV